MAYKARIVSISKQEETFQFPPSACSASHLGGEGLSLSAMAAYQSVGLLSLKIQLSVSVFRCLIRGGADASPKSLSSRLHETRH